jgi:hypothetical protein
VTNDVGTLAAALYAATDDVLKEHPDLAPWRPQTRDVDSLFVPHGIVLEEARNVARDLGCQHGGPSGTPSDRGITAAHLRDEGTGGRTAMSMTSAGTDHRGGLSLRSSQR